MIDLNTLKFGCDAEVFLRTVGSKEPFPVCGLVGGTKQEPRNLNKEVLGWEKYEDKLKNWISKDRFGFGCQEDNAALEVNVPASHDIQQVAEDLHSVFRIIKQQLLPPTVEYNMEECSVEFAEKYVQAIPQLQQFGCEPDLNAWQRTVNDRPVPPTIGFRSASAHVHLGWENPTDDDRINLIKYADIFVVLPHLRFEDKSAAARRQLYGKAGAFRWKEYGAEHRVLGNDWIRSFSASINTLNSYITAVEALNKGIEIDEDDIERIQKAINEHDSKLGVLLHTKYLNRLTKARKAA